MEIEPLIDPSQKRYVIFPVQYPDIWDMYKRHKALIWHEEKFAEILDHREAMFFQTLDPKEQEWIKYILAFFAASDGIVNVNEERFEKELVIPEAKFFTGVKKMMENVHNATYSLMIETYISNPDERQKVFHGLENYQSIRKKGEWALKWIESDMPFGYRLFAMILLEGVGFQAQFAGIFFLGDKYPEKLKALTLSNEEISRDEALHTDENILLFTKHLQNRPPVRDLHEMTKEFVAIEQEFQHEALPEPIIGMNAATLCTYVEYVTDLLLTDCELPVIYNIPKNPCPFMDKQSVKGRRTNFFERPPTNYIEGGVGQAKLDLDSAFDGFSF